MKPIRDIFSSHEVLDSEGRHVNGTDKHGPNHRYGDAYEAILGKKRLSANLIMEIGIADGSSLLAWREIFPVALCVGLDIHPASKAVGERIEFHLGDASNLHDCRRAAGGRQFDFICEDATHRIDHSLMTLLYLWPFVSPGGIYVIEEFENIGELRENIIGLFPFAAIVDTQGPFGGDESLVVLRKPEYGPSILKDAYAVWREKQC